MFFDLDLALAALPELGPGTRTALARLLPGPVTALVPNPGGRFPLACGDDPSTLGLRVPVVPVLAGVRWPVLQSSANLAGGPEARRLEEVPEAIRRKADMLVDGGELPGTASTVIDLARYESDQEWRVIREGALSAEALAAVMEGQFHFHPETYASEIRTDIPVYERVSGRNGGRHGVRRAAGSSSWARGRGRPRAGCSIVTLRLSWWASTRVRRCSRRGGRSCPRRGSTLLVAVSRMSCPPGPFELVASALCVHHLDGEEKQRLFERVRERLEAGGRFVLGDVVVPAPR